MIKHWFRNIVWLLGSGFCALLLIFVAAYYYLNPQLPSTDSYRNVQLQTPLRIYSQDHKLIGEYGEKRRTPISFEQIPPLFVDALLAIEDKRFFEHNGVDLKGLIRAVVNLVANAGQIRSGGSTLTMQLSKNVEGDSSKRFTRKFKEILLALKIERELSKQEILELYLNLIFFGKHAYGLEAAAEVYYGISASQLNLAQMAMLAGTVNLPSSTNPISNPNRALQRRNLVLSRMLEQGRINRATYELAILEPVSAKYHYRESELSAPYLAEMVRKSLLDKYGRSIYTEGYSVFTTIKSPEQEAANAALRSGILNYDTRHGYRGAETNIDITELSRGLEFLRNRPSFSGLHSALIVAMEERSATAVLATGEEIQLLWPGLRWARPLINENKKGSRPQSASSILQLGDVVRVKQGKADWALSQLPDIQGALVALDPNDGAIIALNGGFDFSYQQFNHVTQASRQPGSNIKPFIYTAALEAGGLSAASLFNDAPLVFDDANLEGVYRPRNFGDKFNGLTPLREALYKSINLVSMRILIEIKAGTALEYLARFGFDTRTFPRNVQLAIGGGTISLSPLEVVTAYAALANGGYRIEPYFIDKIANIKGEILAQTYPIEVCQLCEELNENLDEEITSIEDLTPQITPDQPSNPHAQRIIERRVAYIMNSLLRDVIQKGSGRRARALERKDIAGKTGTTNEADTWFSGFNDQVVATAWLGFDNNQALGKKETGSNGPLPIWIDFMRQALAGLPENSKPIPPGVVNVRIDPNTGLLARAGQQDSRFELFRQEFAPTELSAGAEQNPIDIVEKDNSEDVDVLF